MLGLACLLVRPVWPPKIQFSHRHLPAMLHVRRPMLHARLACLRVRPSWLHACFLLLMYGYMFGAELHVCRLDAPYWMCAD
jgi:hypothetical protein